MFILLLPYGEKKILNYVGLILSMSYCSVSTYVKSKATRNFAIPARLCRKVDSSVARAIKSFINLNSSQLSLSLARLLQPQCAPVPTAESYNRIKHITRRRSGCIKHSTDVSEEDKRDNHLAAFGKISAKNLVT